MAAAVAAAQGTDRAEAVAAAVMAAEVTVAAAVDAGVAPESAV
jgi:hypothetical protein